MPGNKDGKLLYRSPKSLVKSPKFVEPLSSLLFPVLSPTSLKSNNENDRISQEQIYDEVVDIIVTEEKNIWISGLILLFFSVLSWILSTQLLNNVMKKTSFDHPLFSSYFNGGMFIFFGLKSLISDFWINLQKLKLNKKKSNINQTETENCILENHQYNSYNSSNENQSIFETPHLRLSHKEIIIVSAFASLLYFTNCFLGSSALKYTSASNQTILATSSSVFSLIIGVILKFEKFTIGKLISVICSMFGILFITFSSSIKSSNLLILNNLSNENIGNLLAIIGACSYSGFLALIRIKLGEQTDSDCNSLVYGYMGFITFICGLPILFIFNYFNWEHFEFPNDKNILIMVLLSSMLGTISDYLGSLASLITSPLTVSLSLSTAIPITMFIDSYFIGDSNFTLNYWIGLILIISSFIFSNIENQNEIVEIAIENAIEEAIQHDEQLLTLLSPRLSPALYEQYQSHFNNNNNDLTKVKDIPGLSIDQNINTDIQNQNDEEYDYNDNQEQQRLVVTGGQNHKYFFREIKD